MRAAVCEILVDRYQKLVRSCVRQYRGSPNRPKTSCRSGTSACSRRSTITTLRSAAAFPPTRSPASAARSSATSVTSGGRSTSAGPPRSSCSSCARPPKSSPSSSAVRAEEAELAERLGVSADAMQEAPPRRTSFSAPTRSTPRCPTGTIPPCSPDMIGDDDPAMTHTIDMESVNAHWRTARARAAHPGHALLRQPHADQDGDRLGIWQMHVSRLLTRALGRLKVSTPPRPTLHQQPRPDDDRRRPAGRKDRP